MVLRYGRRSEGMDGVGLCAGKDGGWETRIGWLSAGTGGVVRCAYAHVEAWCEVGCAGIESEFVAIDVLGRLIWCNMVWR